MKQKVCLQLENLGQLNNLNMGLVYVFYDFIMSFFVNFDWYLFQLIVLI